jgi:hypothetical protein
MVPFELKSRFLSYPESRRFRIYRSARRFEQPSPKLAYKAVTIFLDSHGGDAYAAMTIGRIARKFDAMTIVPNECYSSCALIFIAGVARINVGKLGLHRPYIASEPQSREKLENSVPQMLSAIHDYVKEMRVTDRFYELMVNTDPAEVVLLTPQKTEQIVPISDPVFDELSVSVEARRFGLTTTEMRKRKQKAKACEKLDEQKKRACEGAIKWGLSKETYEEREARAKSQCWFDDKNRFSPKNEQLFKSTPAKDALINLFTSHGKNVFKA